MRDNLLKKQLLKISDYLPESKREAVLRGELLHKIRLHQFNEKSEGVMRGSVKEFAFMLFSPWSNVPALRTVTYFFIGIMVSFGMALGAYTAGPGDSLYPVKLGMERVPLALPLVSEETKFDAELKNAEKRQNEIIEIIASKDSIEDKSKKIEKVGRELTRTIASSEKRVQKMNKRSTVGGSASSLKVSVAKIKQTLDNAIQTEGTGTAKNSKELAQALEKIYAAASVVELSSLEVMVEAVVDDDSKGEEPSEPVIVPDKEKESAGSEESVEAARDEDSPNGAPAQENKGEVKEETQIKTSDEKKDVTDEEKESAVAAEEKGVDKNQVADELNLAIASLRARLDALINQNQDDGGDAENAASEEEEKESDVKTPAEATFEVAEALRLEARQEKIKETEEAIESAELALEKGDFKGAMEFIKKGEELLTTLLRF